MSRDLDTIARRAAENLKAAVESAPLHHGSAPVPVIVRRRPSLRLALIAACLVLGSAVAVALVAEPAPETPPVTTPTTTLPAPSISLIEPGLFLRPIEPAVVTTKAPTVTTVPADLTPPLLEIISPSDGAEVHKAEVTVVGVTEPGAVVKSGERKANVDVDGSWSLTLNLVKGSNHIEVMARDAAGNTTGAGITVTYAVVESTTATTVVKEHAEFVASATFGVCALTPPYDVYYGKGEPGSTVSVQSEYGSGTVVVNGEGQWEIHVFFPEAPAGQAFVVNVSDDLGRERVFEFKYQPE